MFSCISPFCLTSYIFPSHRIFPSMSRVAEQRDVNSSNLSLKGPQQSGAYSVIAAPMNLCAPPAFPNGDRQSGEDSSFSQRLAYTTVQRDAWLHTIHYSSIT